MKNIERSPNNYEPQDDYGHAFVNPSPITSEADTEEVDRHKTQKSGPGGARKKKGPDELLET